MKEENPVTVRTPPGELVLTRIFDAPRALVYKVWTEPKHVAQWFGPREYTNPVCEIDLRVGGKYRYVMRSPEGIDYPVTGVFLEIVENERIVHTDVVEEHPAEWLEFLHQNLKDPENTSTDSKVTVTFEDVGERTKVTIVTGFQSDEVRDVFRKMGMIEGWTQSLEKFEIELKKSKI
ncbi:SRPBCC domain-containing protein [Leptospira ellisii]|uniref:SRPBCC domain-containing protein n=1 Tax=Leptospira ellisii TaxID=2023197 RepID=A0A2N0BNH7_9LEPT|nr:SRPBCC domain-containing protein [Leptospira ellisii]MDV6236709.1 SRPBCC domain-containing protein [Leptospira ellisii]PJZ94383.1 hypothetical protein CH379_02935 [Leptospira ellisii]PKA05531.1 hypothetical protein CH375_04640 [Leptospira ellisii]